MAVAAATVAEAIALIDELLTHPADGTTAYQWTTTHLGRLYDARRELALALKKVPEIAVTAD